MKTAARGSTDGASLGWGGRSRRGMLLAAIGVALFALTLAAYRGIGRSAFVNYDDGVYVTENLQVQRGLSGGSIAWAFSSTAATNWHPLTWLSHMADVQAFGLDAGRHHLTSLAIHAVNAVLLLLLLVRMTGALWRSAFVACLFAIHPLHVESVAWIAERKDVLSTLFWLLTVAAWLRYLEARTARRYVVVGALFALGLMSKPMLVTLPFTLLLLDVWPLGRWLEGGGGMRALLLEKAPLFAMSAVSAAVTYAVQRSGGAVQTMENLRFDERLANAALACVGYLGKTAWPASLAVFYPHPHAGLLTGRVVASFLFLAAMTAAVVRWRRRAPHLLFGWLWFAGTLVPVIGLVQVGAQGMADRYTYVPLIGIFVAIAWGLADAAKGSRVTRYAVSALAAASLVPLFAATRVQVGHWADSNALFEHALAVTSDNMVAHNNLGQALYLEGRTEEAIAHGLEVLRIKPDCAEVHVSLGVALGKVGRHAEAAEHFKQALAIEPDSPVALVNVGNVLVAEGRLDEAIEDYRRAVHNKPDLVDGWNNLGLALDKAGRHAEAVEPFDRALGLAPASALARYNAGKLLADAGRNVEAIEQYREALRLNPDFPAALNDHGVLLARLGRNAEAIERYREALRLRPSYVESLNNLGLALVASGRIPEAVETFEQTIKIQPDYADAHNNLGVALVRSNRVSEAKEQFREALRIKPGLDEARENFRRMEEELR